jgi:ABC-2 type transport system permease protein
MSTADKKYKKTETNAETNTETNAEIIAGADTETEEIIRTVTKEVKKASRSALMQSLGLIRAYFKLNLAASMEYRTSFILQVFGMALNNASFAFFWWILFDRVGTIGNYGFREVMMLWAIVSSSFGIGVVLFGNAMRLNDMIVKGELDSYLLQPKNTLVNILASKTRVSGWGDLVYGFVLFFILFGFDPIRLVLFIVYTITGALLFVSLFSLSGSLAFFLGNANALGNTMVEFAISVSIYPESIFTGPVKTLVFTALPIAYISFVPVRALRTLTLVNGVMPILVSLGMTVLTFFVFHTGLKRYESGNLMINKL